MSKRVLSVGQCFPDAIAITNFLRKNFDVEVVSTDLPADTWEQLRSGEFDLVMINRKLDRDYSDGLDIIKQIKADTEFAETPVMLVTNFAEHHEAAVAAGAEYGIGKNDYHDPAAVERLRPFLG